MLEIRELFVMNEEGLKKCSEWALHRGVYPNFYEKSLNF